MHFRLPVELGLAEVEAGLQVEAEQVVLLAEEKTAVLDLAASPYVVEYLAGVLENVEHHDQVEEADRVGHRLELAPGQTGVGDVVEARKHCLQGLEGRCKGDHLAHPEQSISIASSSPSVNASGPGFEAMNLAILWA